MKLREIIIWCGVIIALFLGLFFYKGYNLPTHYRTTNMFPSPYRYVCGYTRGYTTFNPTGLDKLRAAASGYLDFYHLDNMANASSDPITVLNGLASDVFYLKQKNLHYFCLDFDGSQIRTINRKPLKNLVCRVRQLSSGLVAPWHDDITQIETESSLLSERDITYVTPLPSDWLSNWGFMDNFISFFETRNPEEVLYFHCGHGQGRTTTMLALWDIYNNAQNVSAHDILSRQYLLGGEDLADVEEWKDGTWPSEHLISRRNLVLAFHKYMNDKNGYSQTPWSEWLEQQQLGPQVMDIQYYQ